MSVAADKFAAKPAAPPIGWSLGARVVVSAALLYHLVAVLIHPLGTMPQFDTPGAPPILPETVRPAFQPYITALSLDHTYKFFAPNPGPSHLLRYDLYYADGRKEIGDLRNQFPDKTQHWPRLLYHRYFMLAESLPRPRETPPASAPGVATLGEIVPAENVPRAPPAEGPPPAEIYYRGIAERLARKHGASRVDVFYRTHLFLDPPDLAAGRKSDDPDTYREQLLVSYTPGEQK
ncbi:MAG: hypothetical protein C0483_03455 [Pirellula sp.]|nr:hypothetical protein [Pirellula sp.]